NVEGTETIIGDLSSATITNGTAGITTPSTTTEITENDTVPIAEPDYYSILEGNTYSMDSVLTHDDGDGLVDRDLDGDSIHISYITNGTDTVAILAGSGGTISTTIIDEDNVTHTASVTMYQDGTFDYTVPALHHGTVTDQIIEDSFKYKITDGTNESDWTQVTINVTDDGVVVDPVSNAVMVGESGLTLEGVLSTSGADIPNIASLDLSNNVDQSTHIGVSPMYSNGYEVYYYVDPANVDTLIAYTDTADTVTTYGSNPSTQTLVFTLIADPVNDSYQIVTSAPIDQSVPTTVTISDVDSYAGNSNDDYNDDGTYELHIYADGDGTYSAYDEENIATGIPLIPATSEELFVVTSHGSVNTNNTALGIDSNFFVQGGNSATFTITDPSDHLAFDVWVNGSGQTDLIYVVNGDGAEIAYTTATGMVDINNNGVDINTLDVWCVADSSNKFKITSFSVFDTDPVNSQDTIDIKVFDSDNDSQIVSIGVNFNDADEILEGTSGQMDSILGNDEDNSILYEDGDIIDAGLGYDTLVLDDTVTDINFDAATIANIQNIEAIDLEDGTHIIEISLDDVSGMLEVNNTELDITALLNDGDKVSVVGAEQGDDWSLITEAGAGTPQVAVDNGTFQSFVYEHTDGSTITLTVDETIDTTGM
ncbi:MAG: hypothetical protein J7J96_06665, partial [Sulfurimonas sp.]|nr:hypothetical protein [Sulfurimonas sp.]